MGIREVGSRMVEFFHKPTSAREVKVIPNGGIDRERLEQDLTSLFKAKVIGEKDRLLSDAKFAHDGQMHTGGESFSQVDFERIAENKEESDKLKSALDFLGVKIENQNGYYSSEDFLYISSKYYDSTKTVRLRIDGDAVIFSVKSEIVKKKSHKERDEIEARITQKDKLVNILKTFGYNLETVREKKRTNYEFDFEGQHVKVKYDTSPFLNVPNWLEVECADNSVRNKVIKLLGFKDSELFNGTDADMYKEKFKIEPKNLAEVRFKKPKQ
jgi:adenylate cyclase class IV